MKPEETVFHEITLQDKAWMDRKFAEDDRNACEYSFANNFMWRNVYQVRVAELHGCLVVRFIDGDSLFSFPVGNGDKKRRWRSCLRSAMRRNPAADSTCQRAGPRADARVVHGKILNRGRPERL